MAEVISVARPYAVAAFDEAAKLGEVKSWSELLRAMAEAAVHPEVSALISNPRVTKSQLEDVMLALVGGNAAPAIRNFVKVLAENQRLALLPEIAAMFEAMRAEAERSIDVEVTSAFDLDEAQKQKIAASMKERMGREVKLSCKTDRDLLGGVIIRAGDKVIDGSARAKLAELATALA
jgi:F-type H+-transporting ATPase subunit delta